MNSVAELIELGSIISLLLMLICYPVMGLIAWDGYRIKEHRKYLIVFIIIPTSATIILIIVRIVHAVTGSLY